MNKIRFGIVGTGNIAHRFADAIQNVPQAELSAVASRTKENAEKFGDEYNIPNRFYSYEAGAERELSGCGIFLLFRRKIIDPECGMAEAGKFENKKN